MDAVGELVDIVRILAFLPCWKAFKIVFQRVEALAEIAVNDAVDGIYRYMQSCLVHLSPERVFDVVIDTGRVRILAGIDHSALQFVEAGHLVVVPGIVSGQPLLDRLHRRTGAVAFTFAVVVPGTEEFAMLVAGLEDGDSLGILGAKLLVDILHDLFLADAVLEAAFAEVEYVLVVSAGLEVVAPLLQELHDMGSRLVDGDGSVLLLLLLRLAFLRFALGILRLHGLLGIKLLQIAEVEFEGYRLPVEIGFGIVCQSGTSGDVGACLVAFHSQEMLVVELCLGKDQLEEFEDADVVILSWRILAEDMQSPATDAAMHHHGVLILGDEFLAVFQLLGWNLVKLYHQQVGWLHEVGELPSIAVHLCRDGDGWALWFELVGELLAYLESLAIQFCHVLDLRVAGDE